MSAEMHAFDRLPYSLRRAIDESPFGSSAFLCHQLIIRGHVSYEVAEARIRGFQTVEDAGKWLAYGQRTVFGTQLRQMV